MPFSWSGCVLGYIWRLTYATALARHGEGNLTWPRKAQQNPKFEPPPRVGVSRILLASPMHRQKRGLCSGIAGVLMISRA